MSKSVHLEVRILVTSQFDLAKSYQSGFSLLCGVGGNFTHLRITL